MLFFRIGLYFFNSILSGEFFLFFVVIYLEVPYEDISARISNFSERGLLKRSDQTIQEAYKEREGLYQNCADYIVQNKGEIDSCLNKILSLIKTF